MAEKINLSMGPAEWGMLIILSVLWGGSFFFVEVALQGLPTLTLVAIRVALAALALWAVALVRGLKPPRSLKVWLAFAGMGLLNNVIPFSLIVWGQTEIASGLASIFNATTPLFAVVVAHVFLRDERATPMKIAGVVVGFVGVVVMIGPAALDGFGAAVVAQMAILGAALAYAFAGVFGRRFKTMGLDPILTAAGQVTASSVILTPVALVVDRPYLLPMPGGDVWISVIALALLSTALAYILYFRLLSSSGATNLLLVTFLIPVSAILLGVTLLGEELRPVHLVGMAFIGLGLSAIDGRLWKQRRPTGDGQL